MGLDAKFRLEQKPKNEILTILPFCFFYFFLSGIKDHCEESSENCLNFLLHELTELTDGLHCNSQYEALMSWLPVMMTPIGQKEFNTKV